MTPNVNIWWILSMAVLAVPMEAAAAARDLTAPSSMASLDVTNSVTSQDILLQWMKITAVPLGVFLMGACTWGCIKNSLVWRSLTGRRGESDAPVERPIDSSRDASDVEVGLELSQRRMDDDVATMSAQALIEVQHPPLESPNDEEKSVAAEVAPQL